MRPGFDALEILQHPEGAGAEDGFDRLFLTASSSPPRPRSKREGSRIEEAFHFTSYGLEHAPDAAFWLSEDGRLVYVNEAACRSLGYSRSELLGMHISGFAPRVRREDWPRQVAAIKRAGMAPYETVHRRQDGTVFPVEVTASYAEFGGRPYLLGFSRDIGAR